MLPSWQQFFVDIYLPEKKKWKCFGQDGMVNAFGFSGSVFHLVRIIFPPQKAKLLCCGLISKICTSGQNKNLSGNLHFMLGFSVTTVFPGKAHLILPDQD